MDIGFLRNKWISDFDLEIYKLLRYGIDESNYVFHQNTSFLLEGGILME